jgi:hypothetical protein
VGPYPRKINVDFIPSKDYIPNYPVPRDRGVSDQRLQTRGGERWPGNDLHRRCGARPGGPSRVDPGVLAARRGLLTAGRPASGQTVPAELPRLKRWSVAAPAMGLNATNGLPPGTSRSKPRNTARGTPWVGRTCGNSDFSTPRCCEASRSAGPSTFVCAYLRRLECAPDPWRPARPRLLSGVAEVEDGLPGVVQRIRAAKRWLIRYDTRHSLRVMPGLDPSIHDELPPGRDFRKAVSAALPHGLPGQARQ